MRNPTSYTSPKLVAGPGDHEGGLGAFAADAIAAGELLAVWGGGILPRKQFLKLPERTRQLSVQIEDDLFLVPEPPWQPGDYINHSCDPNAGMSGQVAVVARRLIHPGEQVCIDYAMCDGSPYDEFTCGCGSPLCRHLVTGQDWQNPELWERYAGHFSPYIQRRIDALRQPVPARVRANGRP